MNSNKVSAHFDLANPFLSTPPGPANGLALFQTQNPFAGSAGRVDDVPADAPEGSYAYALVKNGPDVSADEVEVPVSSVEVMVRWGATVLHVSHLTPPRSFYVGEEQGKNGRCDCFVPAEKLGAARAPILLAGADGSISVVILSGATGSIELDGLPAMTVRQAIETGRATPCAEFAGAHQVGMPRGSKAKLELDGFTFDISTGNAGRAVAGRMQLDAKALPYQGISMALHLGLLAAMAIFMPPLSTTDEGAISPEQTYFLRSKLDGIAPREPDRQDEHVTDASKEVDSAGGTGAASKGASGTMGSFTSTKTGGRFGLEGPKDNQDVRVSDRRAALEDAAKFGIIGLLAGGAAADPNAVTAPWGRTDPLGNDPKSALGNMWGNTLDDSAGVGGLGLTGLGEGGDGRYEGIGMGKVNTVGHGDGFIDGPGFGPGGNGRSIGRVGPARKSEPPRLRVVGTTVSGRLPPEVIQRIVRQNFGRFRLCYENGLRNNPNLQGRVAVRFVIGRDGAVSSVGNGGSDMPDSGVVSCVVRSFYGLSFPQPEDGIVTVTYPILFTPGS